eukprot:7384637-Prymnesium_polylepis.1
MISGIRWVVGDTFARCNTRPQARFVAPRFATRRPERGRVAARGGPGMRSSGGRGRSFDSS